MGKKNLQVVSTILKKNRPTRKLVIISPTWAESIPHNIKSFSKSKKKEPVN
jgi:hypothetical protein